MDCLVLAYLLVDNLGLCPRSGYGECGEKQVEAIFAMHSYHHHSCATRAAHDHDFNGQQLYSVASEKENLYQLAQKNPIGWQN